MYKRQAFACVAVAAYMGRTTTKAVISFFITLLKPVYLKKFKPSLAVVVCNAGVQVIYRRYLQEDWIG